MRARAEDGDRAAQELVLGARAARAADERAIDEWGIPSFALMESAGRACADEVQRILDANADAADGEVCILVGPGNNGGDGLVVARTLRNRGLVARVVAVGGVARLERASADVVRNLSLWRGLGGRVDELVDEAGAARLRDELARAALVVDALFGTGLTRPLEGVYAAAVGAANACGCALLAVDLPSGLETDTGAVLGVAVRADVTVTFVARKAGFARGEGPALVGRVVVAEIGIPRAFAEEAARVHPARA